PLDTPHSTLFHLITLSARASTFGGILSPICFAALRLITNSNFIGASTGKSAAFVPLRILSTYVAARRSVMSKSAPYDMSPPASAQRVGLEIDGRRLFAANSATRLS